MVCVKCANDLDHCHSTLVIHLDGQVECVDGDCTDLDEVRHLLVIDCDAVLGGCDCVPHLLAEDILQAS
jgi:hypothetical protein